MHVAYGMGTCDFAADRLTATCCNCFPLLVFLIGWCTHNPSFFDASIVSATHDREQQFCCFFHGLGRFSLNQSRCIPGVRSLTSGPVENNKISFFSGLEVANSVI